ncbi:unnamed protein product [Prorocentrum cordatum]|uniref:DNA-directed RNA polymerase n=1 Tax=Prorocentrum cordatum TaxID=2364126 RepID=A0ABN9PNU4_9DINO|nr:unnamed protein product [Polarella glacialis]
MPASGRFEGVVKLLHGYVTVRQAVRLGRAKHYTQEQLTEHLVKVCQGGPKGAGMPLLRQIAGKLRSKARQTRKWGNVKKKDDKVAVLLHARAPVEWASRNRWTQDSIRTLVAESFRARAVCVTSDRFEPATTPSTAVPRAQRPWSLYGCAVTDAIALAKHWRWVTEHKKFLAADFRVSPEAPLDHSTLQKHFSVGYFIPSRSRHQILTDVHHAAGNTAVELGPSLGTGVTLGRAPLAPALQKRLVKRLNSSGAFRKQFGGRVTRVTLGHLVCEARQNVWAPKGPRFFSRLLAELASSTGTPATERRSYCAEIARYAVGDGAMGHGTGISGLLLMLRCSNSSRPMRLERTAAFVPSCRRAPAEHSFFW